MKLNPYVSFLVKDNPYKCSRSINDFTFRFILPIHITLQSNLIHLNFSMFNKNTNLFKDMKILYPKVEELFLKSAVNIQTAKILKNSINIEYHPSLSLPLKGINDRVFISEKYSPVKDDVIHFSDIHIPLNIDRDYKKINKGIWNQI
jgi:hypothetical protein